MTEPEDDLWFGRLTVKFKPRLLNIKKRLCHQAKKMKPKMCKNRLILTVFERFFEANLTIFGPKLDHIVKFTSGRSEASAPPGGATTFDLENAKRS